MDRKFEGGPEKKPVEKIKEKERKRRLKEEKAKDNTIEKIEDTQKERRLEETIEAERGGF